MKLLRFGEAGKEQPGILDADGKIRDASSLVNDWSNEALAKSELAEIASSDISELPVVATGSRIGPCVPRPGKIICIGLNYSDHAAETGAKMPKEPIIFMKSTTSFQGPNDPIIIPRGSTKTDWEVELGVVIGETARYVEEKDALDYVAGYCVIHDLSEREHQLERSGQWVKGKSHDTFCPTGPWLVTTDEITDPQNLDLWLDVDGVRKQTGSTKTMAFGVATLVSHLSQFMTLEPGDLISSGTPPGVGMGCNPPEFLKPGQTVRLGVEGLGEQTQQVIGG